MKTARQRTERVRRRNFLRIAAEQWGEAFSRFGASLFEVAADARKARQAIADVHNAITGIMARIAVGEISATATPTDGAGPR